MRKPGEQTSIGEVAATPGRPMRQSPILCRAANGRCQYNMVRFTPTIGDCQMNRMSFKSKIGADGVLHLNVPFANAEANRDVQVIIDPVPAMSDTNSHQEWLEELKRTVGTWEGSFERPEQLEYEKRDEVQ
jgi:hypothetical protein